MITAANKSYCGWVVGALGNYQDMELSHEQKQETESCDMSISIIFSQKSMSLILYYHIICVGRIHILFEISAILNVSVAGPTNK